jgi:hypothetical protein
MSLIPAESYSFPDNYSPVAARRSRVLKDRDAAPRPVNRLESMVLPPPVEIEENIPPLQPPAVETNGHDGPRQGNAEMFFQAFGKIAEQSAPLMPAPREQEATPSQQPMSVETNGHDGPRQNNTEMFFQAFGKIAEQNIPPMPAPREEEVLPSQQPMSLETNVMPPVSQGAMFFQALGRLVDPPPVETPPPIEITPEPPRIPFTPRKARPATPTSAGDDVSLLTANGHGRSRNLRPKTPPHALQYLAIATAKKIEPRIAPPISKNQPVKAPAPAPAPIRAEDFQDFDFEEAAAAPYLRQRRRRKIARFFLLEFMAIAVLVPSAGVVLSHDLTNKTLIALMNVLTISAAVAVALIPIMLFAIGPAFTRDRRM